MTALFIGVVSHEGSRFASSQGPGGVAARLAARLAEFGVATDVVVNTFDAHSEEELPVTPAMLQASLTAQLELDRRWAAFLGRTRGPHWWAMHATRWVRREWQRLQPPGLTTMHRLLNIELSHLDLLRHGLASGTPWVLVLEDDAGCTDIDDLALGLRSIMQATMPAAYVNVSKSFTTSELGIDHLLRPASCRWEGSIERTVSATTRPVTNTVCAILYNARFLADLLPTMQALPMEPVVPIDWKLNLALMRLFDDGRIASGDCWIVEPAPIVQLSMQPTAILPE